MKIYILLALIAFDLITIGFAYSPKAFANQFGIHAIDKLLERKQRENDEFSRAVISEIPADFISALINLYAYKREWPKVGFMLSNGVDPSLLRYSIKRASMYVAFNDDLVKLRKLVDNRVDVDAIINSPSNFDELNRLLLPFKQELADYPWPIIVPLPDNVGVVVLSDRLLRWASRKGRVEIARSLLAHGADVHWSSDLPLRFASESGNVELVRLYLAHGADVHGNNDVALQGASYFGRVEVVKILLTHGASPGASYS
jgi:hypothetical protein